MKAKETRLDEFSARMISCQGTSMFVKVGGPNHKKTTIVMDAGYNDFSESWTPIYRELAETSKVFLYDRAGLGKSEKKQTKRTSLEMVSELRQLLIEADIKPPYLLVGHSFGGINMRLFASLYTSEVFGLVVIDAPTERYKTDLLPLFPKEFQDAYGKQFGRENTYEEFQESFAQVEQHKKHLGDIPFILVSADQKKFYTAGLQELWHDLQRDLLSLSSKSKLIIARNSSHYIQNDEPRVVIDAIKEVLNQ